MLWKALLLNRRFILVGFWFGNQELLVVGEMATKDFGLSPNERLSLNVVNLRYTPSTRYIEVKTWYPFL